MIKRITIAALALALAALPMSAMGRTGNVSHFAPSASPPPASETDEGPDDEDGQKGDQSGEMGELDQQDEMGDEEQKGEVDQRSQNGESRSTAGSDRSALVA